MLGYGILALGLGSLAVVLLYIRHLVRREVFAYIDRVAELERRLDVMRSEKRRIEEELGILKNRLLLVDARETSSLTAFLQGRHPEPS